MPAGDSDSKSPKRALFGLGEQWPALLTRLFWGFWVLAGTALHLGRHPGGPFHETMWAEDGAVFLTGALRAGFWDTLTEPIAGYMHLGPRVAGWLAASLPLRWAPATLSVFSSLVVALLSVYVFWASSQWIAARWARFVLAGLTLILPAAGWESSANPANLRLFLVWGAFWAVMHRPETRLAVVADSLVALAAALSDPLPVLLLPLALVRLRGARLPLQAIPAAALLAGAAGQLMVMLPLQGNTRNAEFSWAHLPLIFGARVAGSLFAGESWARHLWKIWRELFAFLSLGVFAAVALVAFLRSNWRSRGLIAAGIAYSLAFFTFPIYARGSSLVLPNNGDLNFAGSRYMVAPVLLLFPVVLLAVEHIRHRIWRFAAAGIVVLGVLGACVVDYNLSLQDQASGKWSDQLATAPEACYFSKAPTIDIPISPSPNWLTSVPCRLIEGAR